MIVCVNIVQDLSGRLGLHVTKQGVDIILSKGHIPFSIVMSGVESNGLNV